MSIDKIDIEEEFLLWIINTYGVVHVDAARYPQVHKYIQDNFDRISTQGIRRSAQWTGGYT